MEEACFQARAGEEWREHEPLQSPDVLARLRPTPQEVEAWGMVHMGAAKDSTLIDQPKADTIAVAHILLPILALGCRKHHVRVQHVPPTFSHSKRFHQLGLQLDARFEEPEALVAVGTEIGARVVGRAVKVT